MAETRAYYNEIDPFCCDWLRSLIAAGLIAKGDVDGRSIKDVRPGDLVGYDQCHFFAGIGVWSRALRLAGWPDDRPVWTGSCPCQPFSAAGKKRGTDDERHLWPAWFSLIGECRPSAVFGEQVASKDGLAWLDLVHADMEGAGYAVGACDTCAAGFGAPHIRQRLYFVADPQGGRDDGALFAGERQGLSRPVPAGATDLVAYPERQQLRAGGRGSAAPPTAGVQGEDRQRERLWDDAGQRGEADPLGVLEGDGRLEGRAEPAREQGGPDAPEPSHANGFWANPTWLPCRDGKWRAVEPGLEPLAHGAPARVGRLRAYGNAICAPVAEAFIRAYMEISVEIPPEMV